MTLVANARMYAVTPRVSELWRSLFAWVGERTGEPLVYLPHEAPAALDALWRRDDLGLAFVCGYPFARGTFQLTPVAAPLPTPGDGRAVYATDLVVRADGPFRALSDTFGSRIGWTAEQSQSGFHAVRTHLRRLQTERPGAFYREAVGPLVTPRRVIEAVLNGEIEVGPLDSYFHALLREHEPKTGALLRIVDTTALTPMPLLAASAGTPPGTTDRLRRALLAAGGTPEVLPLLNGLRIGGFAPVDDTTYGKLLAEADAASGVALADRQREPGGP